jgi:hypothetical protein
MEGALPLFVKLFCSLFFLIVRRSKRTNIQDFTFSKSWNLSDDKSSKTINQLFSPSKKKQGKK